MSKDFRYILILALTLFCVGADQWTKMLVLETIPFNTGFNVIPDFFNLVHVRNYGAAFGLFNESSTQWQFWFFVLTTLIAIVFIFYLAKHSIKNNFLFIGLGLILGGAIGNFIDRIRFRYVIDFLDFYIQSYHWPVFNVADICISIGTLIVGYFYIKDSFAKP